MTSIEEIVEDLKNKINAWKNQPTPSDVEHQIIKVNNGKESDYLFIIQREMEEQKNGVVILTFKVVPRTPEYVPNNFMCP